MKTTEGTSYLLDPDALERADQLIERGDYTGAEIIYGELIVSSGRSPRALALRGYARYRAGAFRDAISDLDEAVLGKPDSPNTLFIRARSKEEIGDLDGAARDYAAVIRLRPDTADAHSQLGMIHEFRGQFELARDAYTRALSIDPDNKIAKGGLENLARMCERQ